MSLRCHRDLPRGGPKRALDTSSFCGELRPWLGSERSRRRAPYAEHGGPFVAACAATLPPLTDHRPPDPLARAPAVDEDSGDIHPVAMVQRKSSSSKVPKTLPIAPSLRPALASVRGDGSASSQPVAVSGRVAIIAGIAVLLALAVGGVAQALTALIAVVTNLAFHGRLSLAAVGPAGNQYGLAVVLVPVAGGLVVGVMARFGSNAIRGHGIPEAMEQILFNQSRIPPRLMFLKPLSAAIAIGTGGPFGAEGPIIATGGALGSVVGQFLKITAGERKVLLAAGAAAGMSATFGSPVSAVLLAIELLLFELRPRSLIPVALASATAAAVRLALVGSAPPFLMPAVASPSLLALLAYTGVGALVGFASVTITRVVYGIEDAFERLPVHWMWWPALGGVVVGAVGYVAPHTLGVGYDNIEGIVSGELMGRALVVLCVLKLVSWSVALGSGTSGGTLAPLFTVGGGMGSALGSLCLWVQPLVGVVPRVAGLVGMAAMFAGASRALLASVVFAFETTRQPATLLPVLAGASAAFLVSCLRMKHSIMTEKIARRGQPVVVEYAADFLERLRVVDFASSPVVSLRGDQTVAEALAFLRSGGEGSTHQGFPVLGGGGEVLGLLTHRDFLDTTRDPGTPLRELVQRPPVTICETASLREASDRMAREGVGRLLVVSSDGRAPLIAILTRSDLLNANRHRLEQDELRERSLKLPKLRH